MSALKRLAHRKEKKIRQQTSLVALVLASAIFNVSLSQSAEPTKAESAAIAFFKELGGKVKIDKKIPGQHVTVLSLEETKVTDAGLIHLEGLTKLQELDLRRTKVTHVGIEKLKKSLPACEIKWSDKKTKPKPMAQ